MTTSKQQRIFRDNNGHTVTLQGMSGGSVVFMRSGYPHPCQQSLEKFKAEFVEVKP